MGMIRRGSSLSQAWDRMEIALRETIRFCPADHCLDFRGSHGSGAVMGMAPDAVRRPSPFRFGAAVERWNRAGGGDGETGPKLTGRRADEITASLDELPGMGERQQHRV